MQRGEADFLAVPQSISSYDSLLLKFLDPIIVGDVAYYHIASSIHKDIRLHKIDLVNAVQVYRPWLVGMFAVASLFLAIVLSKTGKIKLRKTFWNNVCIWFKQTGGWPLTTKSFYSLSSRLLIAATIFSTYFFLAVGLNSVCTDLVSARPIDFVNNLDQLGTSNLKMLFLRGSKTIESFSTSRSQLMSAIWRKPDKKITGLSGMAVLFDNGPSLRRS